MAFFKGLLKYSALFMLSGWMFFMGVLVGRGTAPVEFDTGWFQERLAVIFDDSEITTETVAEKPELDFYSALQKSDLKADYDLQISKSQTSKESKDSRFSANQLIGENSSDLALNDTEAPLKKSKKAMTKLGGKKSSFSTVANVESSERGESNIAKLGNTNNSGGLDDIKNRAAEMKLTDKSANPPQQLKVQQTKKTETLPETKSEQVKEYAQKVYSYTIQIASFNSETDAINHIAKLSEKGYSAYKISGTVGEKTWYRIRLGNFNNITEAKESLKKLEASGIKGLIIQKD